MESWSYSAWSAAVKCLRYHKLVYIDKLKIDTPESGDLIFGSALHSAINSILTGDDGEEIFNIYWASYADKEIAYGRFKWDELRDLGFKFLKNFKKYHLKKYELHEAEIRLYAEYKGIKLEGTPDFIGLYNQQTSLRDFKTSGYNYDKDKALVATQLYLYAYLYKQTHKDKTIDSLGYTVFNKGTGSIQDLTWAFDEIEMYKHLDAMVEYCKLVNSQSEYPKNSNSCIIGSFKCQYFDTCWKDKK